MNKLTKLCTNKRSWIGIIILSCILLCTVGPLKVIFDQDYLVNSLHNLQEYSCCAAGLFVLIYTILTVIGIPGTILTVAGGLVFGLSWGTFWSVLGATLGAMGAFWTARYLLHKQIEKRFGHHQALIKFNQAVTSKPFAFVLAVRFAPISPFNVVNFLFGLTSIHWFPYSLGTFIGIIPGTLAYTWLGVSGMEALEGGEKTSLFLAIGLLTLLSAIPLLFKYRNKFTRKSRKKINQEYDGNQSYVNKVQPYYQDKLRKK